MDFKIGYYRKKIDRETLRRTQETQSEKERQTDRQKGHKSERGRYINVEAERRRQNK
jgi:hypothetical protein